MIQVTAIYDGSEIGYGEGEGLHYAIDDCAASIPSIFEHSTVTLSILNGDKISQIKGRLYIEMSGAMAITSIVELTN